jgi:polysaccharide deacetylase 2 family uncharacterized protein YibQ
VAAAAGAGPDAAVDGIDVRLREAAERHGVGSEAIDADLEIRKVGEVFVRSWRIVFPEPAARQEFIAEVAMLGETSGIVVGEPAAEVGGTISLRLDHGVEAFELDLRVSRRQPTYTRPESIAAPTPQPSPTAMPRPSPPPGARGRLAILLDDAGQKIDLVPRAAALPEAVGIAVLPFLPSSTESAVALHAAGHEVWVHLPMEAVGGADPGPGALLTTMSDHELHDAVFMAVNNIPHAVGVNNHMGSLATADLRLMTAVMQDLSVLGLAFLDSRTTVDTVAEQAARFQGVRSGRRHVFLDNDRSSAAIREQLEEAVYRALTEGEIVAIGHLNEVTIGVLEAEVPRLAGRGVNLVRPTDLLR